MSYMSPSFRKLYEAMDKEEPNPKETAPKKNVVNMTKTMNPTPKPAPSVVKSTPVAKPIASTKPPAPTKPSTPSISNQPIEKPAPPGKPTPVRPASMVVKKTTPDTHQVNEKLSLSSNSTPLPSKKDVAEDEPKSPRPKSKTGKIRKISLPSLSRRRTTKIPDDFKIVNNGGGHAVSQPQETPKPPEPKTVASPKQVKKSQLSNSVTITAPKPQEIKKTNTDTVATATTEIIEPTLSKSDGVVLLQRSHEPVKANLSKDPRCVADFFYYFLFKLQFLINICTEKM